MLIRILIDNPGHTFARNLDAKFASTVKDLLRQGRDVGVQHFLRETLEFMESQRSWDEDLAPMVQMWNKEKGRYQKVHTLLVSGLASGATLSVTDGNLELETTTVATVESEFLWFPSFKWSCTIAPAR